MKNIIVLLLLFVSLQAKADGYFKLGAMYNSAGSGTTSIASSSRTLIDLGAGWIDSSGLVLGGIYGMDTTRTSGGTETNRTSYGPTIGYMNPGTEGGYIHGHYFISSTYGSYKGDGYQVDLGYRFPVKSFGLALQMSYKRFSYNDLNGATVDPTQKYEYVDPYFAIVIPL